MNKTMRTVGTLLAFTLAGLAAADLHYAIEPDSVARQYRVSVRLDKAVEKEVFQIPAWCPGFYFVLNYQEKISDVRAADANGQPLKVERSGTREWTVQNPNSEPISFSYRVLADDPAPGFFGASIQGDKAFVNGPSTFVYSPTRMTETHWLTIRLPRGWEIATAMDPAGDGRYKSPDYDEFIDHPIQMGRFERRKFAAGGKPFESVFSTLRGDIQANLDFETERFRRISEAGIKFWGDAPFPRYLYLVHLDPGAFSGGLEHRSSTVLNIWNTRSLNVDTLAAHEFFHTWNVKRLRPAVLGPFDYTKPVRTKNLWFSEGVTDYYAHRLVLWAGLMTPEQFLGNMAGQIATLQNGRTRRTKTVEDASWEAWENGGFGVGDLSYYNKGLVIGLLLDAALRASTDGEKSLDDLMRGMYAKYGLPKPGFGEDAIRAELVLLGGEAFGPVYDRMVRSTAELPYELLGGIGLLPEGGGLVASPEATERQRELLAKFLSR